MRPRGEDDIPKEIGTTVAVITKVQNTVDGGFRVQLDISADNSDLAAKLLKIAAAGEPALCVAFVEA